MAGYLIDTSVAVHLRDLDAPILSRLAELPSLPALSMLSSAELESGAVRVPALRAFRRARIDAIYQDLRRIPFAQPEVAAYRTVVEAIGYSRPRLLDRIIAATAIVHGLVLITINGADFRDIIGLRLEVWPAADAPAA